MNHFIWLIPKYWRLRVKNDFQNAPVLFLFKFYQRLKKERSVRIMSLLSLCFSRYWFLDSEFFNLGQDINQESRGRFLPKTSSRLPSRRFVLFYEGFITLGQRRKWKNRTMELTLIHFFSTKLKNLALTMCECISTFNSISAKIQQPDKAETCHGILKPDLGMNSKTFHKNRSNRNWQFYRVQVKVQTEHAYNSCLVFKYFGDKEF